jgi:hypothetical protein
MPADSSNGSVPANEADRFDFSSAASRIADAKRLTEEYKEEYKARERDGEILTEVDYHYYADNDAAGSDAQIRSIRTIDGNLQTTVTRSPKETTRFLSYKRQDISHGDPSGREQSTEQMLRDQFDKRLGAPASQNDSPKWLQNAMALDASDSTIPAMDIVFDNVDDLLSAGKFEEVNVIIEQVPLEGPSLSFLMGVLTITLPAADRLPSRARFFARLYRLCKAMGRDAEDLLGGLRRWSGADGSNLFGR